MKDINNTSLVEVGKETKIRISSYDFYSAFIKNNITMLNQVFDDELMTEVMKHCRRHARLQLMGYIAVLKHIYLGAPLITDINLDSKLQKSDNGNYYFNNVNFHEMGFNDADTYSLCSLINKLGDNIEDISLYDLLKAYEKKFKAIGHRMAVAQLYINVYEKGENSLDNSMPKTKRLSNQIQVLTNEKVKIDSQIRDIQAEIDALADKKSRGGI